MAARSITADLLPGLSEWFEFNCSSGCTLAQLRDTLLESGYAEGDVDRFLQSQGALWSARRAGGLYDAEAVASPAEAMQRFWGRLDVLASFNRVSLGDRTVCLLARNMECGICFIPDFLSPEECADLIDETGQSLVESMVVDESDGSQVQTLSRSSRGATIEPGATGLVQRIESRIARLTALPVAHGEGLQILNYAVQGEYLPHFDYFDPATPGGRQRLAQGGQRLATVILYLCDVDAGGATLFPELSLAFTPLRGAALLFASVGRAGNLLPTSLHCGCLVTSGEKWIATKWLRVAPQARAAPAR